MAITVSELFIQAAEETRERMGAHIAITNRRPLKIDFTFPDGVRFYSVGTTLPLLSTPTRKILRDKLLTVNAYHQYRIPTPRSRIIGRYDGPREALRVRREIEAFIDAIDGYPVFVKPIAGSQGRGVYRVDGPKELSAVLGGIVGDKSDYFFVQEACVGEEFRVVTVGPEIELAIRKQPLTIVGDGTHTAKQLIDARLTEMREQGRRITLTSAAAKIRLHLGKQGIRLDQPLKKGREVIVLANKNLSDGASPMVCTEYARAEFSAICRTVYSCVGVETAGHDIIRDVRRGPPVNTFIESNGSPGHNHFIKTGDDHPMLYKRVVHAQIRRAHDIQLAVMQFDANQGAHPAARQPGMGREASPHQLNVS